MPGIDRYTRIEIHPDECGVYHIPDNAHIVGIVHTVEPSKIKAESSVNLLVNYVTYVEALMLLPEGFGTTQETDNGKGTVSNAENTEGA